MRGEDLQGLTIEDLQQLERSLETGLSRVIEKKVSHYFLIFFHIWDGCFKIKKSDIELFIGFTYMFSG